MATTRDNRILGIVAGFRYPGGHDGGAVMIGQLPVAIVHEPSSVPPLLPVGGCESVIGLLCPPSLCGGGVWRCVLVGRRALAWPHKL